MVDRSRIIQKLEDKVAELRDHNLTSARRSSAWQSAITEYDQLVKYDDFLIGIRYLALHSVAIKHGFYVDKRDQQEMLGKVAQEMDNLSPTEVLAGIQNLKAKYPAIYQCDAAALDRMESNVIEFMTRLPVEQQDRAVAEAKNVQLNARPVEPTEVNTVSPQITPEVLQETSPSYDFVENQVSSVHSTQLPIQNNNPSQESSKNALIIGGCIVVGAMIFSMAFLSSKNSQQPQASTPVVKENVPVVTESAAMPSLPIQKSDAPSADKKTIQDISRTRQLYAVDNVASNDVLWIHSGPGVRTPNIGSIPYDGQDIEALGEGVMVKTSLWLPVRYRSFNGWVNSKFLRKQ